MYTPGSACRVSTREASRSLRGRLTDDIRLPKTTKTANDVAIGTHLAAPSGIRARVADGALHSPVATARFARRTPSLESSPHQTSQDAARWLTARVRSVQPERGTGLAPMPFFGSREAGAVISKLMRATPETSATVLRHIPPPTTDSAGRAPSRSRRQSGFQRSPSKHPAGRNAAVHSAVRQRQPTVIEIMSGSIA